MWIAFLDHLAYNLDSLWHRASPISKVIFLAFVISAVIVSKNSLFLLFLLLFIFMLMGVSGLPVLSLSVLLIYPLFFGLVFAFSRLGEAAALPVVTLLRAVTAAAAILLVLSTTHYADFFAVLQYALPLNIGDIMFVTYRSFFLILDSFRNAIKIARLRGGYRLLGFLRNLTLAGRVLGHSLIHAYEVNETTDLSMKVRGYEGRIATSKESLKLKPYDFVVFFLGPLLLFLAVVFNG